MADLVAYRTNLVGFDRAFRSWTGPVGRMMVRTGNDMGFRARLEAPSPGRPGRNSTGINYSTGNLAAQIVVRRGLHGPKGDLEVRAIALPSYAKMLHDGTAPHTIRAKPGSRLVFFWHKVGHVVSLEKVFHPGTLANPFLVRALQRSMRRLR